MREALSGWWSAIERSNQSGALAIVRFTPTHGFSGHRMMFGSNAFAAAESDPDAIAEAAKTPEASLCIWVPAREFATAPTEESCSALADLLDHRASLARAIEGLTAMQDEHSSAMERIAQRLADQHDALSSIEAEQTDAGMQREALMTTTGLLERSARALHDEIPRFISQIDQATAELSEQISSNAR